MTIEKQYMEKLETALRDCIEYAIGFDWNEGYCTMGTDDPLFKSEIEAMLHILQTDEYFEKVRDLKMNDYVIPVYKDDDLLYYVSMDQAKELESSS